MRHKESITKSKIMDQLTMLHVGEKKEVVRRLYYCKKVTLFYLITLCFVALGFISMLNKSAGDIIGDRYINRPSIGDSEKKVNLDVVIDKKGDDYIESNLDLLVGERRYDKDEITEVIKQAEEYIDKVVLGKNKSANEVETRLNLISQIPGTSIAVEWKVDDQLIDIDGEIKNDTVAKTGAVSELTATFIYYDTKVDYTFYVNILPKVVTDKEMLLEKLKEKITENSESTLTDKTLELPQTIDGNKVYYSQKQDTTSNYISIMGVLIAAAIFFVMDKDLEQKVQKRNLELAIDYPEIINKLTLLLGAGMTIASAWGKIVKEYEVKVQDNKNLRRYAYDEMLITWHELKVGVSEEKAIEHFGRRIKLLPYLKLSSLITQNMKKGTSDLLHLLELEAMSAFEERKELAKRLGEEAGTKLLLPMIIMLVIVLIIIMVPAFMSMGV